MISFELIYLSWNYFISASHHTTSYANLQIVNTKVTKPIHTNYN